MRFDEIFTFQPEDDGKVFMCNYSSPAYTQDEYIANDTMKSLEITVQGITPKYSLRYTGWPRPFFPERNAYICFNFEVTQKSLNMGRFDNYTFYLS